MDLKQLDSSSLDDFKGSLISLVLKFQRTNPIKSQLILALASFIFQTRANLQSLKDSLGEGLFIELLGTVPTEAVNHHLSLSV